MAQLDWFIRANLKPRHLQMLVALDELRHIGRAAISLHISQPGLSLALSDLEKGLGLKLFERTPKGVVPNVYGECLIRQARVVLASLTQVRNELHALQSGSAGKVIVGALPSMTPGILPTALTLLKQQSPLASVIVQEGTMKALLPELRRGALDLIVGRLVNRNENDDLSEESLYPGHNVLVVGMHHRLAGRDDLAWKDLHEYPWVLPPVGSLSREPLEIALEQNGGKMPADYIETGSIPVITGYLQQTQAIGLLSEVVARHYVQAGMLAQLPLELPDPQRPIGFTWSALTPPTAVTGKFMQCLRESAPATL